MGTPPSFVMCDAPVCSFCTSNRYAVFIANGQGLISVRIDGYNLRLFSMDSSSFGFGSKR